MAFLGKEYKFEKQENYENFVKALGLTAEETQAFLNYAPSLKFTKNGDSYTLTSSTPQSKNETTFKSGVVFDEKTGARTSKTTITVDGDKVTHVQKYDDGNDITLVRQFSGNEMVLTLTSSKWDGTAKRYYKA